MKYPNNPLLVLGLACGAIFFANLDVWHVNIMEARNFISAREMLTNDTWLLPTLNGQPRYQKPPLPTWLTAFSAALFSIKSVAAMRLPAALMGLILVLGSYKLTLEFSQSKKLAFTAGLSLASSFLVVFAARNGQWDIFTHAFMLLAIHQLYLFFTKQKNLYRHALTAGVFVGLSCMSKGPISVYALLIPFLISFGIIYKFNFNRKKWLPVIILL